MKYGDCSWTMSSYMHISMALSYHVQTVSSDTSILEFSRTQLIILKSKHNNYISGVNRIIESTIRVLLATTRNHGDCTCPRCTIPRKEFDRLGQHNDLKGRVNRTRSYLGDLVERACEFIYKSGHFVTAAGIERMLKPLSLVPTMVRLGA
jgi:hypothetical protein